jgi:hypothetical protein
MVAHGATATRDCFGRCVGYVVMTHANDLRGSLHLRIRTLHPQGNEGFDVPS